VRDRLVLGENIAQTAQFVQTGAADIGIIALSLAVAPALKEEGRYWAGQSHQLIWVSLVSHSCLCAAPDSFHSIIPAEDSSMAPPPAIDPMCAFFAVVHAPRRQQPTTLHALETLLTIPVRATICGAQNWGEIAPWGHAKAEWRAEFLDLPQGMPSPETCGRVFAGLAPESLQQAVVSWMKALAALRQGLVALAGNTIRRSLDSADGTGPMHVGPAWAAANAVVLAQGNVDAKTNEITARPEWLRRLHLAGAVVTLAAMGCQGEIARQMQEHGADSVRS
jgi:DDE_Tnp_1-associated/Bacterial extracellular solute-binding protein